MKDRTSKPALPPDMFITDFDPVILEAPSTMRKGKHNSKATKEWLILGKMLFWTNNKSRSPPREHGNSIGIYQSTVDNLLGPYVKANTAEGAN